MIQEWLLLFWFILKSKVYCEKFMVILKKAWKPSKMVSDQNEKYTIGINMVKIFYSKITVPLLEQQGELVVLICLLFFLA